MSAGGGGGGAGGAGPEGRPADGAAGHAAPLGESLGPAVRESCDGRLSDIAWFRSPWQRGGAATGYATFTLDDGEPVPVVVKLPVGSVEHEWATALGHHAGENAQAPRTGPAWRSPGSWATPVPRVLAGGTSLGGYDLAWLVMERLPGKPLAAHPTRDGLASALRAAADFQARAARARPLSPGSARPQDWDAMLTRARDWVRNHGLPESQRWNEALKHVQRVAPRLAGAWEARAIDTWCHGDLHAGNTMLRPDAPGCSPCYVLLDLALVHAGHWCEDALYLERTCWGHPELTDGLKAVSVLAKCRRELGLPTEGDYAGLANVRRVLMAACAPALVEREGTPRYLHAALEVIERLLPLVAK